MVGVCFELTQLAGRVDPLTLCNTGVGLGCTWEIVLGALARITKHVCVVSMYV